MFLKQLCVMVVVMLMIIPTTYAANHCVCINDPYGGPKGICDYGCISAPCYICNEMCDADGGSIGSCIGSCSGSGGVCQKSSGSFVYDKFNSINITLKPHKLQCQYQHEDETEDCTTQTNP
jgi:hypothetical protein